jgi:flagellar hook-basal body complex protein FliE
MALEPIHGSGIQAQSELALPKALDSAQGEGFVDTITRVLQEANSEQVDAARRMEELAVQGKGSIHEAMIAMTSAEGSFRMLMEMRNRVIEGVNKLLETRF